jgi:hypothetical protein
MQENLFDGNCPMKIIAKMYFSIFISETVEYIIRPKINPFETPQC